MQINNRLVCYSILGHTQLRETATGITTSSLEYPLCYDTKI